jgi:hypothetical protein
LFLKEIDALLGCTEDARCTTPTEYHNPADVEALAKAREAINLLPKALTNTVKACSICKINKECCATCLFDVALEAIDKAGGGER